LAAARGLNKSALNRAPQRAPGRKLDRAAASRSPAPVVDPRKDRTMKKTYEKPRLQKRDRLSAATAVAPSSGFSF